MEDLDSKHKITNLAKILERRCEGYVGLCKDKFSFTSRGKSVIASELRKVAVQVFYKFIFY